MLGIGIHLIYLGFLLYFANRYDNHRDQILRGSQSDYHDDSLDIFPYFTATCYKGFGDDPEGFYAVYSEVFNKIATEDIEFMDSPSDFEEIPKFGISTSDYETVVGPFYAYWQSYCTKKSYSWLCTHNINEIRDRRILREIEKETKKVAQKARKERNEEVRALVAFVRKRDKRVLEYKKILEEKSAQNRIKQQQFRLQQLKKNQQEAEEMRKSNINTFNTSDHEEQLRQLEQAYGSDSEYTDESEPDDDFDENENAEAANGFEEDEEDYLDDLYCVACNKAFKNVLSYENHESSKKHRENLERLKKRMQSEDESHKTNAHEGEDETILSSDDAAAAEEVEKDDPIKHLQQKSSKKSKKAKSRQVLRNESENEDNIVDLEETEIPIAGISIGKISDDDQGWSDDGKKSKKTKNKKTKTSSVPKAVPATASEPSESITVAKTKPISKKGKKFEAKEENTTDSGVDISHTCVTCQSTFDSKNKLFNHLKKTNHGVYIPKENNTPAAATSNGRRGRKK